METVSVKSSTGKAIINLTDFDPKVHEAYDDESKAKIEAFDAAVRQKSIELEAERIANANYGQVDGSPERPQGNASGTFDEPTPTDVRFPNKNTTEFESNHGAQVGKSAAGMREEFGIEQKPGGLYPEVKEKVDQAEAMVKTALEVAAKPDDELRKDMEEKGTVDSSVEIPDNWAEMHWKQQVSLAGSITGNSNLNAAEARQAIEDELAKREAAKTETAATPAA